MANTRVIVVDDSAAMRALFSDILEQAKGIDVVGVARSADEASEMIEELKPDVLTLDVEMPGKTGMEFLEELMASRPMPVVMLSSVTQQGTGTAEKALKLGAAACFPKPLHTSPEEFSKTVGKLGEIVIAAHQNGPGTKASQEGAKAGVARRNSHIVALAAGMSSIEVVRETIAAMTAECPATVILIDAKEEQVERAVDRLRPSAACTIEDIEGESILMPGTVYLAYRKDKHIVFENDYAPVVKSVERDPIGGFRPSADMFFASLARTGLEAIGGLLANESQDGVRGLEALSKSGAKVFAQKPDEVSPHPRFESVSSSICELEKPTARAIPAFLSNVETA